MENEFPLNYKLRAIDDLFENLIGDLDDQDEFLKKYEIAKKQFLQLTIKERIIFKGFCILFEELSEILMMPEFEKKMKISFIIYWQKSVIRSNFDDIALKTEPVRAIPKFSSTKKAILQSSNSIPQNCCFTIHNHLSSLMNEYAKEYNSIINNKKELNLKIQQANILLSQRNEIIKLIVQYKIKNYNRKSINQSERRNLRMISDLMYLIDTMNRDLKKKAINSSKK